MKKTHVKICCISSIEEAQMATQVGASALGLVGNMPSGPGVISDEKIKEIVQSIKTSLDTFLLTSETTVKEIYHHWEKIQTSNIQIVDAIPKGAHAELRSLLPPSVKIIQVIHVMDEWALEEASALMHQVDALLLDSGNPTLKVKTLGGTGQTHNWEISRKIVQLSKVPVWLAGGLKVENVKEAIEQVQPYGLDLCNGVRSDGNLDFAILQAFLEKVNS